MACVLSAWSKKEKKRNTENLSKINAIITRITGNGMAWHGKTTRIKVLFVWFDPIVETQDKVLDCYTQYITLNKISESTTTDKN